MSEKSYRTGTHIDDPRAKLSILYTGFIDETVKQEPSMSQPKSVRLKENFNIDEPAPL